MNSQVHSPWIARQTWVDLLFIHWPVPVEVLRPYVPSPLDIETFNGMAWVGIVPFRAIDNRLRGMPFSIPFSSFLELNVRTYVSYNGEPGVYFISMDANHLAAVKGGRYFVGLPYFKAEMSLVKEGDSLWLSSEREHPDVSPASFHAKFYPVSKPFRPEKNSLTYWLTERYRLWKVENKKVVKVPIWHNPWTLQEAALEMPTNTLIDFLPDIDVHSAPLVHYSAAKTVRFYPFEKTSM